MLKSSSAYLWDKAKRQYNIELEIGECKPGMETAAAVYRSNGAVIVPEGIVLDTKIINGLKKLEVDKVKVYVKNEDEKTSQVTKAFREKYFFNLDIVRNVIQDLYSGKPMNISKINLLTDSILENNFEDVDIIHNISHLRDEDEYRYTHSLNVSMLSMLISKWLKFNEKRTEMIVKAGLLHDIGNAKISANIINKPQSLLPNEYEQIKKHPNYGGELVLDTLHLDNDICKGILMHHEREDGSGYPSGLKGEEIHEFAKIIGIADVFDAMTTKRVYKDNVTPFDVYKYMQSDGLNKFNKRILMTFLEYSSNYYKGEKFFLNTGEIGEVISINTDNYSRPIIRIGEAFVDLRENLHIEFDRIF